MGTRPLIGITPGYNEEKDRIYSPRGTPKESIRRAGLQSCFL